MSIEEHQTNEEYWQAIDKQKEKNRQDIMKFLNREHKLQDEQKRKDSIINFLVEEHKLQDEEDQKQTTGEKLIEISETPDKGETNEIPQYFISNIQSVFLNCLADPREINAPAVLVETIRGTIVFDERKLMANQEKIAALLGLVKGLNSIEEIRRYKNDQVWGELDTQALSHLIALGIATNYVDPMILDDITDNKSPKR